MSVHALHLVWKRGGEDVELGTCFDTTRPVVGELIAYTSGQAPDQTGVWKVKLVYHQAFMSGTLTWRDWRERGVEPECMTYYWVEPAEGPWEP
jgi:hypothetical protein